MFTAALVLSVASYVPVAPNTPSIGAPVSAYREGCHPYASKTLACKNSDKAAKAKKIASAATNVVCHPDPTKSRACDARARKSEAAQRLAAREDDGSVVKE